MIDLNIHYPTNADCRNIQNERIAFHYHFILLDKQIAINYSCKKYIVQCFGWKPSAFNGFVAYDGWYKHSVYDSLESAENMFVSLVSELICMREVVPF